MHCPFFWHKVLSGHVESSSRETSCDSQSVFQANSGTFTAQNRTKHLLIYPFFLFLSLYLTPQTLTAATLWEWNRER